jgi:hypothetical protein
MALNIGQIAAVSYADVLTDQRKAANQWGESAAMRLLESMGFIDRRNFGATIEAPLDYRRNPGATFLATDMQPVSLSKTEVFTAASFDIAELSVPVTWSKGDDVKNPTENQKIAFVKGLLENGIQSHDDLIEEALFASATEAFIGLPGIIPTTGQGVVGGIDAGTETMWRNPADTYLADGSDMEAVLTSLWNTATKGTGSPFTPKVLLTGNEAISLFESTQTPMQRFNGQDLKAGANSLWFKTAQFAFSQYGDDKVFGISPRVLKLAVSKGYFRDKGETKELEEPNAFGFKIYSALQMITNNKSRLFVASEA